MLLEQDIIKRATSLLLLQSHDSKDSVYCMYIQGYWTVSLIHCHQVEHSLRVEIALIDSKWFNRDVLELMIRLLYDSLVDEKYVGGNLPYLYSSNVSWCTEYTNLDSFAG